METASSIAAHRLAALARASVRTLEIETDARGVDIRLLQPGIHYYHSFVTGALARRARQPGQALVKACRGKSGKISSLLDLTAGWGADGLTLAHQGLEVTLLEHNPLLCAILDYSIQCLAREPGGGGVAARMRLEPVAADDFLEQLSTPAPFDCIYLDPMFPAHKSGAKPAGEMQILQALTENRDIEECLRRARARARRRVVVKRPLKAPPLSADEPDIVYCEKTIRFDVYLSR